MTDSRNLLYLIWTFSDQLKVKDEVLKFNNENIVPTNQDFWYDDGISLTGNPLYTADKITLDKNVDTNKNGFWKYNEDKILKQLEEYLASTYSQHYVDRTGGGTEQTLDKIKHNRREGFCAGNVTKYIDRYDTKGTPRQDLFKVLHYTMLLINHLNLIENK